MPIIVAAPRLEIDLDKIFHNANELVTRLAQRGISVTGVTKAFLGSTDIANTLLQAGVSSLADSRIENIEAMRFGGQDGLQKDVPVMLIRSPMLSQVKQIVAYSDLSFNTEIDVIKKLSVEACKQGRSHQILLMVELGDLREGIMPDDLLSTVDQVLGLPNIVLKGIGANLACRSGVSPDATNMALLCELAERVETTFDLTLDIVSGGNSANINWALSNTGKGTTRINNLRLGEAILLGREALQRRPLDGLHTDAFTLVAEVIEAKLKPTQPTGVIAQAAFGETQSAVDRGSVQQSILAIGIQDIDPCGLQAPAGIEILSASSDHLVVESASEDVFVGQEMTFKIDYSALLRAMTSPFIAKHSCRGEIEVRTPSVVQ